MKKGNKYKEKELRKREVKKVEEIKDKKVSRQALHPTQLPIKWAQGAFPSL